MVLNAKILANNPPAILITLGGLGWLGDIAGAGWLLFFGIGLQLVWLARLFI